MTHQSAKMIHRKREIAGKRETKIPGERSANRRGEWFGNWAGESSCSPDIESVSWLSSFADTEEPDSLACPATKDARISDHQLSIDALVFARTPSWILPKMLLSFSPRPKPHLLDWCWECLYTTRTASHVWFIRLLSWDLAPILHKQTEHVFC